MSRQISRYVKWVIKKQYGIGGFVTAKGQREKNFIRRQCRHCSKPVGVDLTFIKDIKVPIASKTIALLLGFRGAE